MVEVPAELLAPVPDGVDVAQAAGVGLGWGHSARRGRRRSERQIWEPPLSTVPSVRSADSRSSWRRHAVPSSLQSPRRRRRISRGSSAPTSSFPRAQTRHSQFRRCGTFFGGGVDTAIHVAGDLSVAAGVVRPGGKFTSVTDTATPAFRADAEYVPTIVAPSGHKLADLLFKVAAHRLHSHVGRTLSFDQVGDAVNAGSNTLAAVSSSYADEAGVSGRLRTV